MGKLLNNIFTISIFCIIQITIYGQAPCPNPMTFVVGADCMAEVSWVEPTLECEDFDEGFADWEEDLDIGNGSTQVLATSLTVVGSNLASQSGNNINTDICIEIPCDGDLVFDWLAVANMGGAQLINDEPAYVVGTTEIQLPHVPSASMASGIGETVAGLSAGDNFCFRVRSNNIAAITTLTITNFVFSPVMTVSTSSIDNPSDQAPGTYTVDYNYCDCNGDAQTCSFDITVEDRTAIMLTCASDLVLTCLDVIPDHPTTIAEYNALPGASITDNCALTLVSVLDDVDLSTLDFCLPQTINRTFTFSDLGATLVPCTQMISWPGDIADPVLLDPRNVFITCDDDIDPNSLEADYSRGFPRSGTDDCSIGVLEADLAVLPEVIDGWDPLEVITLNGLSFSYEDTNVNELNCTSGNANLVDVKTRITRTWTLEDECGKTHVLNQFINIEDITLPEIVCPTATITVSADAGMCGADVTIVTPTFSDNCSDVTIENDITLTDDASGFYTVGTHMITWLATDACENMSLPCVVMLVVEDETPPTFADCPIDMTVEITDPVECVAEITWTVPTVSDECGVAIGPVPAAGDPVPGDLVTPGIYEICYTASDVVPNVAECCFTITVLEFDAGSLGCRDLNLGLNAACSATLTPLMALETGMMTGCLTNYEINIFDPEGNSIGDTVDDTYKDQTLRYQICLPTRNICCWADVMVLDEMAPTITGSTAVTALGCNGVNSVAPPVAVDNCSGAFVELTNEEVDVLDGADCHPTNISVVTRTYVAIDGCGNRSADFVQVITLERLALPELTCPLPTSIECGSGYAVDDAGNPAPSAAGFPMACATQIAGGLPITGFTFIGDLAGSYYYISDYEATWATANTLAQENGGHLACIADLAENTFIASYLNANAIPTAWIGLTDEAVEGTFEWVCGDPLVYTNWETVVGEPNDVDGIEEYTEIRDNGFWNDNTGVYLNPIILEFDEPQVCVPINTLGTDKYCNSYSGYVDQIDFVDECTTYITRLWEVREWHCTGELVESCMQQIVIEDNTGPEVDVLPNVTVSVNSGYECRAHVTFPEVSATDNCSIIDFTTDIQHPTGITEVGVDGAFFDIAGSPHTVTYNVTDRCDNTTTLTYLVNVVDNSQPIPVCESDLVVSIASGANHEVLAEMFNDNSWDECGYVTFEVARMATTCDVDDLNFGPSVNFCCADVGTNPMVFLKVEDSSGNTNVCMVEVDIQDKIAPTLDCMADETVDCTEDFDLDNLRVRFGWPTVEDNCLGIEPVETVNHSDYSDNSCGIGNIIRTFTLTDHNGTTSTCQQIISVENGNAFNLADIDWPDDYVSDNCDPTQLDPEDLLAIALIGEDIAFPRYEEDECELVGFNFTQDVAYPDPADPNATYCLKILRKWKVINWCGVGTAGFDTWTHEQVIKVENNTLPVITSLCEEVVDCSFAQDCGPSEVSIMNDATVACDAIAPAWTYSLTDEAGLPVQLIDLAGMPYLEGTTNEDTFMVPLGEYTILWTVTDQCGNEATCEQALSVRNCKSPIPVCREVSIDVEADPDGDGTVNANPGALLTTANFDGGSYHSCSNAFALHFDENDVTSTDTIIECISGANPSIMMYITDLVTGASDFVECDVVISDPDDLCTNFIVQNSITGRVSTENNRTIENVMVELKGASTNDMTDENGHYSFPAMPDGGDYTIDPQHDINPLNGVSTLDLVLIQRHILGLQAIESPYKLLAADVNNDDKLTSIDLLELRKLILGVYQEFPNNESWRFVDQAHNFLDPTNPWAIDFAEAYDIYNLNSNMSVDFVGFKVGDVNSSVSLLDGPEVVESRQDNEVKLSYKLDDNQIELIIDEAIELSGIQLSIELPEIKIEQVESAIAGFSEANYYFNEANHTLNISWHSAQESSIEFNKDASIFILQIQEDLSSSKQFDLKLDQSRIQAEAYLNNAIFGLELRAAITESKVVVESGLEVFQNVPNPWGSSTMIKFYIPEKTDVAIRFYNVHGQLIKAMDNVYEAGMHHLNVNRQDLDANGVVIYEIVYKDQAISKRMILMD